MEQLSSYLESVLAASLHWPWPELLLGLSATSLVISILSRRIEVVALCLVPASFTVLTVKFPEHFATVLRIGVCLCGIVLGLAGWRQAVREKRFMRAIEDLKTNVDQLNNAESRRLMHELRTIELSTRKDGD